MSRAIMQQAFDAFEDLKAFATDNGAMPENWDAYYPKQYDALEVLRRALALPEQVITPISPDQYERFCGKCGACLGKPWVGLTGTEINHIFAANVGYPERMCLAIEAKLKEKNT
jgi:hypothetical protein